MYSVVFALFGLQSDQHSPQWELRVSSLSLIEKRALSSLALAVIEINYKSTALLLSVVS